ncbi:hypothetical protein GLYMA_17G108450v4 [Glycine max]|nr:hypothetical protein GYH30_046917 [Glycine max]KRH03607.2 hypothetical protein GLYMA_17G108450v4 [Glycine max]
MFSYFFVLVLYVCYIIQNGHSVSFSLTVRDPGPLVDTSNKSL